MRERLILLTADQEAQLLCEAGFDQPAMFYAAPSFQDWVAYAGRG
jgi:tRNA (cmo5U34)-methyltransferase